MMGIWSKVDLVSNYHFLTIVNVQRHRLVILEKNYLLVYIYERWNAKLLPRIEVGQQFQPKSIEMVCEVMLLFGYYIGLMRQVHFDLI